MTSLLHDSAVSYFLLDLAHRIDLWLTNIAPDYEVSIGASPLLSLTGVPIDSKAPDGLIDVVPHGGDVYWPAMVLEVGYSETTAQLQRDARNWLLGTLGSVKSVLLIKLKRPHPADFNNWREWIGWIEVWVRSAETP
jgi:hypothetical protein